MGFMGSKSRDLPIFGQSRVRGCAQGIDTDNNNGNYNNKNNSNNNSKNNNMASRINQI